jgi:TfoX/Sxy family transcriptional regulator of competence genes
MPGFAKSPPELIERFDAVATEFPDVAKRLTFGYPCLYVGGNMVSGLHESGWFVRLGAVEAAEALALDGAAPFEPMPGRPMTGYTLLPQAVIDDDAAIRGWVERAIDFGATLPPKAPKSRAKSTR